MKRRPVLVAGFLALPVLLTVAACGNGQTGAEPGRRQVRGEYELGGATLHYVATYQDSILVAVEEEQTFGDDGQATARYEVVDGRLVYYRADEQRRVLGQDQQGDFETIVLELEFDDAGRIRRHAKLVDGHPTELVGYEAPGVQRHFEELKRRVDTVQGAAVGGM